MRHAGVQEIVAIEGRDFNIEKAELVQSILNASKVRFLQGNLETFDFAPLGQFDAVYCVGVLYHLPRPWELLEKLANVADVLYINTHYCARREITMTLHGYEGKQWDEFGYEDPLSGMSAWSFWPTLEALTRMLRHAGFVAESSIPIRWAPVKVRMGRRSWRGGARHCPRTRNRCSRKGHGRFSASCLHPRGRCERRKRLGGGSVLAHCVGERGRC